MREWRQQASNRIPPANSRQLTCQHVSGLNAFGPSDRRHLYTDRGCIFSANQGFTFLRALDRSDSRRDLCMVPSNGHRFETRSIILWRKGCNRNQSIYAGPTRGGRTPAPHRGRRKTSTPVWFPWLDSYEEAWKQVEEERIKKEEEEKDWSAELEG